jgi:hypothetical protein
MIRSGCVLETHRNKYAIDVGPSNKPRYVCPRNIPAQGRTGGHPRTMIVRDCARVSCILGTVSRSIGALASLSKYLLSIVKGKLNVASNMSEINPKQRCLILRCGFGPRVSSPSLQAGASPPSPIAPNGAFHKVPIQQRTDASRLQQPFSLWTAQSLVTPYRLPAALWECLDSLKCAQILLAVTYSPFTSNEGGGVDLFQTHAFLD